MAVDKLVDSAQLNADLTSVANAIRTKGGTSGSLAFPAGFVSAIGDIPTGGSSAWTKVAEKTYQVNTTSTGVTTVEYWQTGHDELFTTEKWVYVRVRDTAGKRTGYFYGSDNFFLLAPANPNYYIDTSVRFEIYPDSSGTLTLQTLTNATGYGVYVDEVYYDGTVGVKARYGSAFKTINGTYKVEVYLLDPAGGVLPFA